MEGVFGILTVAQWLAILRIGLGLWWLKSVLHKPLKKFVSGQMVNWTLALADNHPVPAYGRLIKATVAPNASWFPYLVLAGEDRVDIRLSDAALSSGGHILEPQLPGPGRRQAKRYYGEQRLSVRTRAELRYAPG